jgi:hypothetical protein
MGTVFGAATMFSSIGMAFGPLAGGWVFDTLDAEPHSERANKEPAVGAHSSRAAEA